MAYFDDEGKKYKKVAENGDKFFLAPVIIVEGYEEYDYTNIKVFSKESPDYPIEKVVDYRNKVTV